MTLNKQGLKQVNKSQLIDLLSCIYQDFEMAITGKWDSTYDKDGFVAQQILIDEFCKNNKLRIRRK